MLFPFKVVAHCEEMVSRSSDLAPSTANWYHVHQVHHPDANFACAQAMKRCVAEVPSDLESTSSSGSSSTA